MLSRFIISKSSYLRCCLISISSRTHSAAQHPPFSHYTKPEFSFFRSPQIFFSTSSGDDNNTNNGRGSDFWKLSSESEDDTIGSVFGEDEAEGTLEGFHENADGMKAADEKSLSSSSWVDESSNSEGEDDIFKAAVKEDEKGGSVGGGGDEWLTAEGFKPWTLEGDNVKGEGSLFGISDREGETGGLDGVGFSSRSDVKSQEDSKQLELEEKALLAVLKGPNRAFGDLVAASGITDEMLDSLIALKDFEGIQGLPPLREIEDLRYEKSLKKSTRADLERLKQEEVAKSRVRQVDDKGRAYGTGKRKCSIARVWIQPGDGKFVVNDKEFDVYFPMLDHRAALLRPFSETKTLGLWDVSCTVKGGGVSGQVGAIRLGISRALQNWEPNLRPPLRDAGFLTRDSRVVERKKPGKAKARKSFQWVKR